MKRLLFIVTLCLALGLLFSAQASDNLWETYDSFPHGMEAVFQDAEGAMPEFVQGYRAYDQMFFLVKAEDGYRVVLHDAVQKDTAASAAFPALFGHVPKITGDMADFFTLIFADDDAIAAGAENYEYAAFAFLLLGESGNNESWKLDIVNHFLRQGDTHQAQDAFFQGFRNRVEIIEEDGQHSPFYGHVMTELASVDFQSVLNMLNNPKETLSMEGLAMVNNPNPKDRLNLREKPNADSASLGKYYNGTFVELLGGDDIWAHVNIHGRQGYMMRKFLAADREVYSVVLADTDRMPMESAEHTGLPLYEAPDKSAAVRTVIPYGTNLVLLGDTDGGWCHVLLAEGIAGFVESKLIFEGNG